MPADHIRWTILVSRQTDIDVRTLLARQGGKKGDLSKFVEEALIWRLLELQEGEGRDVDGENRVSPQSNCCAGFPPRAFAASREANCTRRAAASPVNARETPPKTN